MATKTEPRRGRGKTKGEPVESSDAYETRRKRGVTTVRTQTTGHQKAHTQGMATAVTQALKKVSTNGKIPSGEGVVPMTITPEIAGDLLGKNTMNRKMRDPRVIRIAKDIQDGRWQDLNGETIKIADDGTLLDGQHRLTAVIVANQPITTYVAFGVSKEAFETIDTGLKRSGQDTLFVAGEDNARGLSNTLNAMFRYLSDGTFRYRLAPTNAQLLAVLEATPGLRESAEVGKGLHKRLRGAPEGVMAVLHYLFSEHDKDDAEFFFSALKSGAGLTEDDPIYTLRERLSAVRSHNVTLHGFHYQHEVAVVTIKAWNAFRDSKPMTHKQLRYWEDEKLPEIR